MDRFETLLDTYRPAVERWIRFRVAERADAEDLLQEIYLAAYQGFPRLRAESAFRPWILGIARRKYADWCRRKAASPEIPMDQLPEAAAEEGGEESALEEMLSTLPERERMMLRLFYRENLPQKQIARQLRIPEGTVKSRLHTARSHLRTLYMKEMKGEAVMKTLPTILPPYTIEWKKEAPFPVRWEETMGWFIVPRVGEKVRWGMYDLPSRKLDISYDMEATGRASVHGIEGVEIHARTVPSPTAPAPGDPMAGPVEESGADCEEWIFVAQMTEDYTRFLSAERTKGGVRTLTTFLDGDAFFQNWGFGEDNCGKAIHLAPRGVITRAGNTIHCASDGQLLDVVGRCTVTLDGKAHDTVCVMDVETYVDGVVSEQFVGRDGRTVLWRRFNRDDWAMDRFGKRWSQLLPDNERLTVRGETYVHWYDCLCLQIT